MDPYGWSGSYPDPYAKDIGNLWLTGSPRYAGIAMPSVNVSAAAQAADPTAIDVSWSSPGSGNSYNVYVVYQDGSMKLWKGSAGAGSGVFQGKAGHSYWFWSSVTTGLGWSDANGSPLVMLPVLNHGPMQ